MKKTFFFFITIIFCCNNYAQWFPSLTITRGKSIASISAATDKNIWVITTDFTVYNTLNGGTTWNKIQAKGFGSISNLSVSNLYVVSSTVALLSVDSIFTGVGPGFIYRTTDGGRNWTKVFSHKGNCDIKMGMFTNTTGLISCSFSSFNGSIPSGQALFYTTDGGASWKPDPINPSDDFNIVSFTTNGLQVAMSDFSHVYFSADEGRTWSNTTQVVTIADLQFTDSSYAMGTTNGFTLMVKRPGTLWKQSEADSVIDGGLISGLVLDNNECWIGEGLDKLDNYYSADSGKTFTTFFVDSSGGFIMMGKARKGRTIMGVIGAFNLVGGPTLWLNTRQQNLIADNKNENAKVLSSSSASLQQNIPNPFSNTTTISYTLPQQYASAKIIITDRNGSVIKQINLFDKGKGSVLIDGSTFLQGAYHYALIVDGKMISSKQMELIK